MILQYKEFVSVNKSLKTYKDEIDIFYVGGFFSSITFIQTEIISKYYDNILTLLMIRFMKKLKVLGQKTKNQQCEEVIQILERKYRDCQKVAISKSKKL